MIIFDLRCDHDHRFEGWFRHADDFEAQLDKGMIACPQCDSPHVRRVPSAVAIASSSSQEVMATQRATGAQPTTMMPTQTQMNGLYRQLLNTLLAGSENVGTSFAEEARKIHYNEAPERTIHGQTTPEEREALHDEGILVVSLPAVSDDDLN